MTLIDALIIVCGLIIGGFLAVTVIGIFLMIRAFIRWIIGNDDDTLSDTRPRVRTRIASAHASARIIQHSPNETGERPSPLSLKI